MMATRMTAWYQLHRLGLYMKDQDLELSLRNHVNSGYSKCQQQTYDKINIIRWGLQIGFAITFNKLQNKTFKQHIVV